jgi:soluble lytic murein transglycosylase-like protein
MRYKILITVCITAWSIPFLSLLNDPRLLTQFCDVLRLHYPSSHDSKILVISERHGIDHLLIRALIRVESCFEEEAISPRGAMGLMQLMPGTAKQMGINNPFDPNENIDGGVRYLKFLLRVFDDDLTLALAAYNAGPEAVKKYKGIPPYRETQAYLRRVMAFYKDYKKLP